MTTRVGVRFAYSSILCLALACGRTSLSLGDEAGGGQSSTEFGGSAGQPGGGAAGMAGSRSAEGGSAGADDCTPPIAESDAPWLRALGSGMDQRGDLVAVGPGAGMVLAGRFNGTLDFGNNVVVPATGELDAFVAGFDSSGNATWTQRLGEGVTPTSLVASGEGRVVLGGNVGTGSDFNATVLGVRSGGGAFVLAIEACGRPGWHDFIPSSGDSRSHLSALAVGPDGGLVAAGAFQVGSDPAQRPEQLIRYSATGERVWSARLADDVLPSAVALDQIGNLYVLGRLSSGIAVLGLDPSGAPRFSLIGAHEVGGYASVTAAAIDGEGNLLVGGSLSAGSGARGDVTLDFGAGVRAEYECCGSDAFVASVDPFGTPRWIRSFGGLTGSARVATGNGHTLVATGGSGWFDLRWLGPSGDELVSQRGQGGAPVLSGLAVEPSGSALISGFFYHDLRIGRDVRLAGDSYPIWTGFAGRIQP